MKVEQYARRAADLALAQVADRAHALPGAAGARPGQPDGTRQRPAGVTLVPPRTDPSNPAVFTAQCDEHFCGGRFDQTGGGIAGGRVARPTDIDLLVYLAELASLPEDDWQPFFEFFSPRCLDDGPPRRIVWGEDCRGRRHFDAAGLVNWCMEQAVDARYPITFDAATWATDASGTVAVPVTDPPRPGDLVLADRNDDGTEIGILVGTGDSAGPGDDGGVVLAAQTTVGVVRRPFDPTAWTQRRRPTTDLLHD